MGKHPLSGCHMMFPWMATWRVCLLHVWPSCIEVEKVGNSVDCRKFCGQSLVMGASVSLSKVASKYVFYYLRLSHSTDSKSLRRNANQQPLKSDNAPREQKERSDHCWDAGMLYKEICWNPWGWVWSFKCWFVLFSEMLASSSKLKS